MRVLFRQELPVSTEDDVVLVRRRVRDLAQRRGFSTFAIAAITTATSEVTRNVVVHAGSGHAVVEEIADGERIGIRVALIDRGPGIRDVEVALAGGNSTANSLGLGLSGSRRLVDEFTLQSTPSEGTRVEIVKWAPF